MNVPYRVQINLEYYQASPNPLTFLDVITALSAWYFDAATTDDDAKIALVWLRAFRGAAERALYDAPPEFLPPQAGRSQK